MIEAPKILRNSLRILGFSILALGFLTSIGRTDPLTDALSCLQARDDAARARDGLIFQADSLGRLMIGRQTGPSQKLLRRAEHIEREAMDRSLDLLQTEERCRTLASTALEYCAKRMEDLRQALDRGTLDQPGKQELLRLQEIRARLQATQESESTLHVPILAPDSSDTQEILKSKLQYYHDAQGYLEGLAHTVSRRIEQVREEGRVLAEAGRFLGDINFLDEGERGPTGAASPNPGVPIGGAERPGVDLHRGFGAGDLEFALRMTPTSEADSEQLARLLQGFGLKIQRELGAVTKQIERLQARVVPEGPSFR